MSLLTAVWETWSKTGGFPAVSAICDEWKPCIEHRVPYLILSPGSASNVRRHAGNYPRSD
ncbi:hypothetical protein J6590_044821 [Homalodisca vitripennis]|nr:hypothetical protein J6590_044821 [Homalodisca vitripennis]